MSKYTFNNNDDDDDDNNEWWRPNIDPLGTLEAHGHWIKQMAQNQEQMAIQLKNLGKSYQINHTEINTERNHRNVLYQNEVMLKEAYDNHQGYIKTMEIDVALMKETITELTERIRKLELAAVKNKYKGE